MSMIKRVFKWIGYALLALIVAGLIGYLANKTYMDRYFRMAGSQIRGQSQQAEWYEPVDKVPGADGPPLAVAAPAGTDRRSRRAQDRRATMPNRKDSYGFVVWQGGKLQDARLLAGLRPQPPDRFQKHGQDDRRAGHRPGDRAGLSSSRSTSRCPTSSPNGRARPRRSSTIRDFLQNSSGISRFDYSNNWPWSQTMREYLGEHHEDLLINETEYQYKPGSEYDYSMITSDMLAIVVERATRQRYADYVGKELLQPIGAQGGTVYINRPGGLAHSGCCMMLPAESFIRMGVLMAKDGMWDGKRILAEGWIAETLKPSPANPKWGLHMWLGQPYQQRVRFFPERSPEDRRATLRALCRRRSVPVGRQRQSGDVDRAVQAAGGAALRPDAQAEIWPAGRVGQQPAAQHSDPRAESERIKHPEGLTRCTRNSPLSPSPSHCPLWQEPPSRVR